MPFELDIGNNQVLSDLEDIVLETLPGYEVALPLHTDFTVKLRSAETRPEKRSYTVTGSAFPSKDEFTLRTVATTLDGHREEAEQVLAEEYSHLVRHHYVRNNNRTPRQYRGEQRRREEKCTNTGDLFILEGLGAAFSAAMTGSPPTHIAEFLEGASEEEQEEVFTSIWREREKTKTGFDILMPGGADKTAFYATAYQFVEEIRDKGGLSWRRLFETPSDVYMRYASDQMFQVPIVGVDATLEVPERPR